MLDCFLGTPMIALGLAVIYAMIAFGRGGGMDRNAVSTSLADSLPPIAGILLIVGAGGGFKQVLIDTGIDTGIGTGINTGIAHAVNGSRVSALAGQGVPRRHRRPEPQDPDRDGVRHRGDRARRRPAPGHCDPA